MQKNTETRLLKKIKIKKTKTSTFKVIPKIQKRGLHTSLLETVTQADKVNSNQVNKVVALAEERRVISPIKINEKAVLKPFSTFDIETINHNNTEYPVAISIAAGYQDSIVPEKHFFTIDKSRLKYENGIPNTIALENEVLLMFKRVYRLLGDMIARIDDLAEKKEVNDKTVYVNGKPDLNIFVHNLGAFDGIFIFKYLTKFYPSEHINTIIDKQNKFIVITLTDNYTSLKIKFLDSYRLFPV